MTLRRFSLVAIVLSVACLPGGGAGALSDTEVMKVHRSAILIDTHNDITGETVKGLDVGQSNPKVHTDLARLRSGGAGAVFFAAYVASSFERQRQSARRALEMIDTVRTDIVAKYPDEFALAISAADIEAARKRGKIAALLGIEGGHAIEDSLRLLRDYYRLGVRYMTLTHTNTNNWADSSGDFSRAGVTHHGGLTDFGREVVREMNRLGMIVDVSHAADKTFWDVLAASSAPVFASHSSCRAISNIPRNMTDEMIVAMAKKGGVIQINFGCDFLSQKSADAARVARKTMPRATLADVVAHIDHAVKIAGMDAVGIGTDYDGVECVPIGLDDVSKFPSLTRALLEKGYSPADIRKIYGGNTLRLMRAVEKTATANELVR